MSIIYLSRVDDEEMMPVGVGEGNLDTVHKWKCLLPPKRNVIDRSHMTENHRQLTYLSWSLERSFLCSQNGDFPLPGIGGLASTPTDR